MLPGGRPRLTSCWTGPGADPPGQGIEPERHPPTPAARARPAASTAWPPAPGDAEAEPQRAPRHAPRTHGLLSAHANLELVSTRSQPPRSVGRPPAPAGGVARAPQATCSAPRASWEAGNACDRTKALARAGGSRRTTQIFGLIMSFVTSHPASASSLTVRPPGRGASAGGAEMAARRPRRAFLAGGSDRSIQEKEGGGASFLRYAGRTAASAGRGGAQG